jgi:hypothetical protein
LTSDDLYVVLFSIVHFIQLIRLGMLTVIAVLGITMAIAGAGTAMASGGPGGGGGGVARLQTTGTYGDILDLRLKKTGGRC